MVIVNESEQIRLIQIQTLYKNTPNILFASIFSALMLLVVYWGQTNNMAVLGWFVALVLISMVRGITTWKFNQIELTPEEIDKWWLWFTVPSIISVALWGFAAYFFYIPGGGQYQAFGIVVPLALGAGLLVFLSMAKWLFYSSFLLVTLPLMLRMFVEGDFVHVILGAMILVYIGIFMVFGHNMNTMIINSLKLRFQNENLVKKLTEEKEYAEKANIAKSKFLAAASHDLRQPLHALSLLSSALCDRIKYPEVKHIVDKIMLAVSALENLFNALLDISKLDSGVLKPNLTSFRLREIFRKIENDYKPEADRKGIEFVVTDCDNVILYSDNILLERTIRNFVSNALRYTDNGAVKLYCKKLPEYLLITVEDSGIGIHAESLQTIFDEYVQIGNPERDREKGLGLGLAIVAKISQLLNHKINVESEPGIGSKFTIKVPYGREEDIPREYTALTRQSDQGFKGLVVLIIDDERSNLEALDALLRGWQCKVIMADSADTACASIKSMKLEPDCILSDYRLRENKTGIEAIHAVSELIGHDVPAVLITGDVAIKKLHEEGADKYHLMHKPVQPARLRALLKHMYHKVSG
ncbi:MAG: hybrid sensor histidine kinase/response regulator [Gammaproteobacteria bacterium]|nr:hybrid sensor histidine kinase/response regulator [Gammaproteobacteria bacterium]